MKAAVGVMVLLGTGWIIGVFMNIPEPSLQITLQYFFILLNASQVIYKLCPHPSLYLYLCFIFTSTTPHSSGHVRLRVLCPPERRRHELLAGEVRTKATSLQLGLAVHGGRSLDDSHERLC